MLINKEYSSFKTTKNNKVINTIKEHFKGALNDLISLMVHFKNLLSSLYKFC